jgi:emp24/gp25L/p24 family/GOLD
MPLSMYASRTTSQGVSLPPLEALHTMLTIPLAKGVGHPFRHVELDIDIGADAKDWSAVQATEKLKPVETELRRIEEMVAEIVAEMDYLRTREQKLRDTNESTNTRVKWFAFGTMGMLVALGAWQVIYLRAYFRYVMGQAGRWRQPANKLLGQSISSRSSKTDAGSVAWREIHAAMDLLASLFYYWAVE